MYSCTCTVHAALSHLSQATFSNDLMLQRAGQAGRCEKSLFNSKNKLAAQRRHEQQGAVHTQVDFWEQCV
eukprot:m.317708 g.317708  ORF g.317708 m.317708 type:complete len:70 (-) comp19691_c0_seq3:27-236(-)